MKIATLIGIVLSLLVILIMIWRALSPHKPDDGRENLRSYPAYAPNNYKHPNKADTARGWDSASGVLVPPPAPGTTSGASYKRPVPGQPPAGGIVVPYTPPTDVADQNYKMPRPNPSPAPTPEGVARKRPARPDTTHEAGNE